MFLWLSKHIHYSSNYRFVCLNFSLFDNCFAHVDSLSLCYWGLFKIIFSPFSEANGIIWTGLNWQIAEINVEKFNQRWTLRKIKNKEVQFNARTRRCILIKFLNKQLIGSLSDDWSNKKNIDILSHQIVVKFTKILKKSKPVWCYHFQRKQQQKRLME